MRSGRISPIITILIIWRKKEESKETMALEIVTDGKNNKTEKNDQEYVHNKSGTRDGTCKTHVPFCLYLYSSFPFFLLLKIMQSKHR